MIVSFILVISITYTSNFLTYNTTNAEQNESVINLSQKELLSNFVDDYFIFLQTWSHAYFESTQGELDWILDKNKLHYEIYLLDFDNKYMQEYPFGNLVYNDEFNMFALEMYDTNQIYLLEHYVSNGLLDITDILSISLKALPYEFGGHIPSHYKTLKTKNSNDVQYENLLELYIPSLKRIYENKTIYPDATIQPQETYLLESYNEYLLSIQNYNLLINILNLNDSNHDSQDDKNNENTNENKGNSEMNISIIIIIILFIVVLAFLITGLFLLIKRDNKVFIIVSLVLFLIYAILLSTIGFQGQYIYILSSAPMFTINLILIIYHKKEQSQPSATANFQNDMKIEGFDNNGKDESKVEQPPKLTWEEISEEEKKIYIDNAIKQLYEKQLNDTKLEMSRQQRALKKDSLDTKEFYLEDLTDEEKVEVEKIAKAEYITGEKIETKPINNVPATATETSKKFIKGGIKWFVLNSMISTTARNRNTKTATFNKDGTIKIEDNSNKASAIRPCGKCTAVSGEKPIDFVVGLNPFTKTFSCCGVFHGFSFKNEDIIEYKQISSNSNSERYELLHINGKKISLSLTPLGADLLNAVLGNEKFKS
jgi:hypothetical protein